MRTTVSIDDQLLLAAKQEAHRRGQTLGKLVEDAIRRELQEPQAQPGIALPVFRGGTGAAPGVDLRSNRALAEYLDERSA
jgi:hypothetical protein